MGKNYIQTFINSKQSMLAVQCVALHCLSVTPLLRGNQLAKICICALSSSYFSVRLEAPVLLVGCITAFQIEILHVLSYALLGTTWPLGGPGIVYCQRENLGDVG